MISSVIDGTERAVSKAIIWLLGIIVLSLFLLVGLSFLGYALFLFAQSWLSPIQSALFISALFVLIGFLCIASVKRCTSPKSSQKSVLGEAEPLSKPKSLIKDNPTMSLSLSVAAGFLYQSDPRLKEEVTKMLTTLAEQYIIDLSEQSRADRHS